MNRTSMIAAAALLAVGLAGCQTTNADMGWREAEPPRTPIRITLDRADFAGEEHYKGSTPFWNEFPRDAWISRLGNRSGSMPRLVVVYNLLTEDGTGFVEKWPVEQRFHERNYEHFRGRDHEVGAGREMIVRGVPMEVANIATPGVGCFSFTAVYGPQSPGLIGDRLLDGYYCRRGEEPISDAEALEVLSAISTPAWR